MIRDKGPRYILNYGTKVPYDNSEEGVSPESGIVAKALGGHPIMRFFAVSAATMVGMHVAGKVVRDGGVKIARKIEEQALSTTLGALANNHPQTTFFHAAQKRALAGERLFTTALRDVRKLRKDFEDWETNTLFRGLHEDERGFDTHLSELQRSRRMDRPFDETQKWSWSDEMKNRMLRQAKTLPYALPAAYVTQRAIVDPMMGEKRDVQWYNPVDVIGDFAQQSMHDLAFMIVPWEAGSGTVKHGFSKFMSQGKSWIDGGSPSTAMGAYSAFTRQIFERLGQDAGSLLSGAAGRGTQFTVAFTAGLRNALAKQHTFSKTKEDLPRAWNATKGGSPYKRMKESMISSRSLDTQIPGIRLGGFHTFAQTFHQEWKSFGATAAQRRARTLAGTNVEAVAASLRHLTGSNDLTELKDGGALIQDVLKHQYRKMLTDKIRAIPGLDTDKLDVDKLADLFTIKSAPRSVPRANSRWTSRVEIIDKHIETPDAIAKVLTQPIARQFDRRMRPAAMKRAEAQARLIAENLGSAVRDADVAFVQSGTRQSVTNAIRSGWAGPNGALNEVVLPYLESRLGKTKIPYEVLERAHDPEGVSRLFLGRKLLQSYGIKNTSRLSPDEVRSELLKRGRVDINNPGDFERIRSLLVRKGMASAPWNPKGYNIFGFRPMTLQEGLSGQTKFFDPNVNGQLYRQLQTMNEAVGRGSMSSTMGQLRNLRVGGVWTTRHGQVLDLSPMVGAGRQLMNTLADHFQVPALHIRPLNTFFYSALRSLGSGPGIRFGTTGVDRLIPEAMRSPNGYFWMNNGRNSYAQGMDLGIGRRGSWSGQDPVFKRINRVRAAPTDAGSLIGRSVRLAIGDRGIIFDENNLNQSRFKRMFNIDRDQPNSVFGWIDRLKKNIGYSDDLARARAEGGSVGIGRRIKMFGSRMLEPGQSSNWDNPAALARMLAENPNFIDSLSTAEKEQFARAFGKLQGEINLRGKLSPHTVRQLEEDPYFKKLFSFAYDTSEQGGLWHLDAEGKPVWSGEDFAGDVDMASLDRFDTSVVKVARRTLNRKRDSFFADINPSGEGAEVLNTLQRAQKGIRFLLNPDVELSGPAPTPVRIGGISRRIDELKQELLKYSAVREEIIRSVEGSASTGLGPVQKILSIIDENRGAFSAEQYSEMRMAALSIQAEFMSAQIGARRSVVSNVDRTIEVARGLVSNNQTRNILAEMGGFETRFPGSSKSAKLKRSLFKRFSVGNHDPGLAYNPFGGGNRFTLLPTTRGALGREGLKNRGRALASVLGLNTWSDPTSYSTFSVLSSHLFDRLDSYVSTLGAGLDSTMFKGPLDYYTRGLVGRRVLPIVAAGTTLFGLDATLGGLVRDKDPQGRRVYAPLIGGGIAAGAAFGQSVMAGLIPGGQSFREKYDELFHGEVPVRKGRWWPLGNTPWEGGRVQYYRPSWYRRFTSGYQYTGQLWDSPAEKMLFGYDYSPLRPLDPYRFERKHYKDRPYAVTGEYFTGPWGPLTGFLNATVGRVLKPSFKMHRRELEESLSQYATIGEYGATIPRTDSGANSDPLYVNDRGRMRVGYASSAGAILGHFSSGDPSAGGTRSFLASGISAPVSALGSLFGGGRDEGNITHWGPPNIVSAGDYSRGRALPRQYVQALNERLTKAANQELPIGRREALSIPYYINPRIGMTNEVVPNLNPIKSTSARVQASQLGYELQEMAGIYGFAFGSLREAFGFGGQDLSPKRPVYTSAARAYGSERRFWDLNFGGMGDLPTPFEGDYANLELSEIVRRFVPHRRRDIIEMNPIPNTMGKEYPWLPGENYFTNFHRGDPYALIAEGEMRLPGAAWERFNKLHPDQTGRYGIVDQLKILGDVAPYSDQYRSLLRSVTKAPLTQEERDIVTETRRRVAEKKRIHTFSPYKFHNQDFQTQSLTIESRVEGTADQFITKELGPNTPLRVAGVRARSMDAQQYVDKLIKPGARVTAQFDANASNYPTVDAIIKSGDIDLGQELIRSGFGQVSQTDSPIDLKSRTPGLFRLAKGIGEYLSHMDNPINAKFNPNRTAQEDWERRFVYGSTFQQWQHPYRDYLKPMIYKASMRNPILSTAILAGVGRMFSPTREGKAVGTLIGGAVGLGASFVGHAMNIFRGEGAFMPEYRAKEAAIEEYMDILKYVKYTRLYGQARAQAVASGEPDPELTANRAKQERRKGLAVGLGPIGEQALQFRQEIQKTMYGADPFGDINNLVMAVPKRMREHFAQFLSAPKNERKRILSTQGRLQRRILEAKWGMDVEQRPDLNEYFQEHELPPPEWEGWDPAVDLENVKLKVMQSQGLDLSQIGYYPQQVRQANLINPSYPDFLQKDRRGRVVAQLQSLMANQSISGMVTAYPNGRSGDNIEFQLGVA